MPGLLNVLKEQGFTFYQTERYNLDHEYFEPYQDDGEEFESNVIFETDNKTGKFIKLSLLTHTSLFTYFLDGSRYTYKVGDLETTDGKFMPIVSGQLGAAVCVRDSGKLKKYSLLRKNALLLFERINKDDFLDVKNKIEKKQLNSVPWIVQTYDYKSVTNVRPENLAIAKIQKMLHEMELDLIEQMVKSGVLKPECMLIIDGPLQFVDKKADERLFANVIGISKSFNPNLQGLLKKKTHHIATSLAKLRYGERTPVYKYPLKGSNKAIGAWYLRIRPEDKMNNPLDGIVKVEKIAIIPAEKEDGFDSSEIDNISRSILLERNVTCHGLDKRWPAHLYPIYLTESFIKQSFLSPLYFLNIF